MRPSVTLLFVLTIFMNMLQLGFKMPEVHAEVGPEPSRAPLEFRRTAQGTPANTSPLSPSEKELAHSARYDPSPEARIVAVSQIKDQSILKEVATKDTSAQVRSSALDRLTDQDAISRVILGDPVISIQLQAVTRLSDQRLLSEVVRKARDRLVQERALDKIVDEQVLASLAHQSNAWVIERILEKTPDEKSLLASARDEGSEQRSSAAKRVLASLHGLRALDPSHKVIAGEIIAMINAPEIVKAYGDLKLDYQVSNESHRYTPMDGANRPEPYPKGSAGTLLLDRETVRIIVADGAGKHVLERTYRGADPQQIEQFPAGWSRKNTPSVNLEEICEGLLKNLDNVPFEKIARDEQGLLGRKARSIWIASQASKTSSDVETGAGVKDDSSQSAATSEMPIMLRERINRLLASLGSLDVGERRQAGYSIQEVSDERALGALLTAFKGSDTIARRSIAVALGNIRSPRSLGPLIDALKDSDAEVRRQAVWALGRIGDPSALEPLSQKLKDDDLTVRAETERAISLIKFGR